MQAEMNRKITDVEIETYQRDGIVLLKGLFDPGWVAHLEPLVEAALAEPGPLHLELDKSEGDGRFFFDTFLWPRHDGFRRFLEESPAAEIAAQVMGSRKVNIFFDQLLVKEPGTEERTPWHHDLPYWPVEGNQVCTLWLALDHVTAESGAVEYVRGSHRWGRQYHPAAFAGDDRYNTDLPRIPDFEAERESLDIVQFELEPGDCTLHHGLTVHSAPGNTQAKHRRRAYVVRWAGDDAVYAPGEKIMPILWEPKVSPGDPLDCDLWPVMWRERAGAA